MGSVLGVVNDGPAALCEWFLRFVGLRTGESLCGRRVYWPYQGEYCSVLDGYAGRCS